MSPARGTLVAWARGAEEPWGDGAPGAESFMGVKGLPAPMAMHRVWGPVSIVLAVLGVIWYLYFGAVHGRFADVGVYSVTVMLLGFGLAGLWASRAMVEEHEA